MKIGDNAKVKTHEFYDPHHAPYVGFSGTITEENTIGESIRYQVRFADGKKLWFFATELEAEWPEQKRRCQKDLLNNSLPADDPKQSHLKAGFIVCLGEA